MSRSSAATKRKPENEVASNAAKIVKTASDVDAACKSTKGEPKAADPPAPVVPSKASVPQPVPQAVPVPTPTLPSGDEEHAVDALKVVQEIYPYVPWTCSPGPAFLCTSDLPILYIYISTYTYLFIYKYLHTYIYINIYVEETSNVIGRSRFMRMARLFTLKLMPQRQKDFHDDGHEEFLLMC